MKKFTVFTVIMAVLVVVVSGEMFLDKYFPGLSGRDAEIGDNEYVFNLPSGLDLSDVTQTDVLGSDEVEDNSSVGVLDNHLGADVEYNKNDDLVYEEIDIGGSTFDNGDTLSPVTNNEPESDDGVLDFEDDNYGGLNVNVYLRDDQVQSAGFPNAYLETEPHNGLLYKTIYVDDLYNVEMTKYIVRNDNSLLAKVYVITIGPNSTVNEVYEVLKVRAADGLDVEINETADYGDGSFYMNDARRPNTAFLTVKFGQLIYGFSYPKDYHPQIKNLITLIDLEF